VRDDRGHIAVKGVIFNLLAGAVCDEYGEDAWDELLDRAGLEGAWTSVGSYPHKDLLRVVAEAATMWQWTHDDVIRWFGRSALPRLASAYPTFFDGHTSAFPFLRTLNEVHHLEVLKIYPDADLPVFTFDPPREERVLTMRYSSARALCTFGEGLIHGAGDHFGERLTVEQPECVHRGDEVCVLLITSLA
jgi:hypothetical protein